MKNELHGKNSKSRGTALVAVLVFIGVLGLIAASLARLSFTRSGVHKQTREKGQSQLAVSAGLNSIQACLYGQTFPPTTPHPAGSLCKSEGWTEWAVAGASRTSKKCLTMGDQAQYKYRLTAKWSGPPTESLEVDAELLAAGASCP